MTHILLIILVLVLVFGPTKLPALGRGIAEGFRGFKKSLKGEEDIDITASVRRIEDDDDSNERKV